jgi:hypothetical protein
MVLWLSARKAHASPLEQSLQLSWDSKQAAPTCPTEQSFRETIKKRHTTNPFTETAHRRLSIRIVSRERNHEATLTLRDPAGVVIGTRQVFDDTKRCQQLSSALVLIVTLLLEGRTTWDEAITASETPPKAKRSVAKPQRTELPRTNGWVAFGTGLAARTLPNPTRLFTLQAGGSLFEPFEIEIGAAYLSPETVRLGQMQFAFAATEFWLAPVYAFNVAPWLTLRFEVGVTQGWLHSDVQNARPNGKGELPFTSLRFGNALDLRVVRNVGLRFAIRGQTPLARQRLWVSELPEPVFTQPWFGGRAEILATYRFR